MRTCNVTLIVVALTALTFPATAAEAPGYVFERLTPAACRQIDGCAVELQPPTRPLENQLEFYGDIFAWAVSRTPLPAGEERRRADEVHGDVVRNTAVHQPPALAGEVLLRLTRAMPARSKSNTASYSLFMIDAPPEPAFTSGNGRIYVASDLLNACVIDRHCAPDRLAFVIARQLGHLARGHARRRYQWIWMREQLQNRIEYEAHGLRLDGLLERALQRTDGWARFLYSDEETRKADLFALHLCRNAGFDVERCLDAIRERAFAHDPSLLSATPAAPPTADPAEPPTQAAMYLARLRQLRGELDGTATVPEYGLFAFDPATQACSPARRVSVAADQRAVVFLHEMESDVRVFTPLAQRLAESLGAQTYVLRYPNDGSLARSGKLLRRAVLDTFDRPDRVDFVCHSAGGLVFRCYAEVEQEPFRSAVLLGTPHHGSDLARLRALLEVKQLLWDARLGYSAALERTLLDAKGEIAFDLQPGSLFLKYLNRPREVTVEARQRYAIVRGRALSRRKAFTLTASFVAGRIALSRAVDEWDGPELLRREASRQLARLELPDEITKGDLAVTLESAQLEGVPQVETFELDHLHLLKAPEAIDLVERWLASVDE